MDDLVKEEVLLVDVHKAVVVVLFLVQVINYLVVLRMANVIDDGNVDNDDATDNVLDLMNKDLYCCQLIHDLRHHNYWNAAVDDVYLNVFWMIDVGFDCVAYVMIMTMMLMTMIENGNENESVSENVSENEIVNETESEFENAILNDCESEIMND